MTQSETLLPDFFEPLLREQYDDETVARIIAGCSERRATTLRANTLKATRDQTATALDEAGLEWEGVNWYDDAFVLQPGSEAAVRALTLYQEGGVYVQSLSSMIPALVLGACAGEDVCDLCAAPGGKTTQISALSGGGAYITACEMHASRAEKLQHNLEMQGTRSVTVLRTDARRLDDFFSFDRILVDAPCSGSGTLRASDARVPKRFTPALIAKSMKAQRALLAKGLQLLKPGGTLVYSTCSVLARENEEIVEWALGQVRKGRVYELQPVEISGAEDMPALPSTIEEALLLCPTNLYEGFFVAKIKRKS